MNLWRVGEKFIKRLLRIDLTWVKQFNKRRRRGMFIAPPNRGSRIKRIDANQTNERSEIVARQKLLRLAESQGSNLASQFEDLLGDGGRPNETADEMISAIREWRDASSKIPSTPLPAMSHLT